ncbi:MAG: hypothetical protein AAGE18_00255 [Pseudomonadota bacterium]
MTGCLVMVRFRLVPGARRNAFLATAPEVTDWFARQPGFQYRTLVEGAGGSWMDLIWWDSTATAQAAARKFIGALGATAFMAAIDPRTIESGLHPVPYRGDGSIVERAPMPAPVFA